MKKELLDYPGYYVDTEGLVYSGDRVLRSRMRKKYKAVTLSVNGATYTKQVHRLVLETFVGPCPIGYECAHNDGDPLNNKLSNLRWATKSENQQDRRAHGTYPIGEKNSNAKLSWDDVQSIRASKMSQRKLARNIM